MTKKYNYNHIFDCYPVYVMLYGSHPVDKHTEAMCATVITEAWLDGYNKRGWKDGIDVLEILSGISEHEPYYRQHATFSINTYYNNDLRSHPESEERKIIVGDACTTEFPEVDIIFAHYYAAAQIMDDKALHTRDKMLELYENMYHTLNENGAFVMDFADDGQRTALEDLIDRDESGDRFEIYYGHPLREFLGLPATSGKYHIRAKTKLTYDRVNCRTIESFDKVEVHSNRMERGGTLIAEFNFKLPFTQRYWTESELVDIAKEAGFTKFMFWHEDMDEESNFIYLPEQQRSVDWAKDPVKLMANKLVAIKG